MKKSNIMCYKKPVSPFGMLKTAKLMKLTVNLEFGFHEIQNSCYYRQVMEKKII